MHGALSSGAQPGSGGADRGTITAALIRWCRGGFNQPASFWPRQEKTKLSIEPTGLRVAGALVPAGAPGKGSTNEDGTKCLRDITLPTARAAESDQE